MPAPVLFTTNCLMPPKSSYADRVFTTEVVSFPGLAHIGEDKDFTPVIEKALVLGGYAETAAFYRYQRRYCRYHRIRPSMRCSLWRIPWWKR